MRHSVTLTMRPVPEPFAAVYRRRGIPVPEASSGFPLAALWPFRFRSLHRAYAERYGYFWLPCVLCGLEFGGHEITASIPDPTDELGRLWQSVCPACAAERHGGKP